MTRARVHVSPEGNVATADCRKVSGADFFRTLFPGPTREERYAEYLERLARLIEVGADLYGHPPLAVADARKMIAERQLTETIGDPLLPKNWRAA